MNDFWLKVKVWTKTTLVGIALIYGLLFIYNNSGETVNFWWWFGHNEEHGKLTFGLAAFLGGVVITILIRTLWSTFSQVRSLQSRARTLKIERDIAEMKEKAARLQTRGSGVAPAGAPVNAGAFDTAELPPP